MDMSEHFVQYQEREKLLTEIPHSPWQHHLKMHKEDPKAAYLWLAQINAGHPISEVRGWADRFLKDYGAIPTFTSQRQIIDHLRKKEVEIYIITASVKWAVEPGARLYGVDEDHVIGVATQVKEGLVTTEQDGEITWREGKVKGLLNKTNGVYPFFAAGNSSGDLPLIESATDIHLVVSAAQPGEHTYETEQEMLKIAEEREWYRHRFN
ncbi:MAG: haloacid dehalogenase-like hydrolase [Bdellovibrionales bacterium]|nr:haloacid dehalogenase-like hydrolase [Bdellovibrionales bacterium]